MVKIAKNELFAFLNNLENPKGDDFQFIESNPNAIDIVDTIRYLSSPMQIHIETAPNYSLIFRCSYTIFSPRFTMSGFPNRYDNIKQIIDEIDKWINRDLAFYIEENNSPDLWAEYLKGKPLMSYENSDFDEKGMFTLDEKKQILLSINELKLLVKEKFGLSQEHANIVDARLDYLVEGVDRLNRFDWKGTAVNIMISIGVALSFNTDQGKELFNLFLHVFRIIPQIANIIP